VAQELVDVVGGWVAGLRWSEVPEAVREATLRGVMHSIAGGVAGFEVPETKIALDIARRENETGPCTIYVHGRKAPITTAIFTNSVMFCALEQQEMHVGSATHPLEIIVPVALALAERHPTTGVEFLEAVLAGTEVMIAFATAGLECKPQISGGSCLGAAVYGAIGSAVAAARLLRLGGEGSALALLHAANFASGLNESNLAGMTEYHFALANASRSGYLAAQLAASGAEAAPGTFEGASGFYHRFAEINTDEIAAYDFPRQIGRRLGRDWAIPENLYKPYPVHFYNLPFVDGARVLRTRHRLSGRDIDAVRLTINHWCEWCNGGDLGPYKGREATRAATTFAVAAMLARGRFGLEEAEHYDAEDITKLVKRTSVGVFVDTNRADDWRSVRIEIDSRGKEFVFDSSVETVPDYRLSMAEIRKIAHAALSRTLDPGNVPLVLDALAAMDRVDDVGAITTLLVRLDTSALV
jgi:2-methylcitrate dehydratase PrpD